jgi:hypothetical protein
MNSQLPYWLAVLQALSTPAIALLAIVIGVMQWRTAHQRAVLDLFQKRWESYSGIKQIVGDVIRDATAPTERNLSYARATDEAKFLFGPEVHKFLQNFYHLLVDLHHAQARMKARGKDYEKWVDREAELLTEIETFFGMFDLIVAPYMRMHQKMPWF